MNDSRPASGTPISISLLKSIGCRAAVRDVVAITFEARNKAHLAHWATSNASKHETLGEFYEAIIGKVDELVENAQGRHGKLDNHVHTDVLGSYEDIITVLRNLRNGYDAAGGILCESELLNILDEMKSIINTALYKLENLE